MKWTEQHDLELVKEILAERPFDHPKGSRQIGQIWQTIVDHLNSRADIVFVLKDIRAIRDRFNLLEKKFKRKQREEIMLQALAPMSLVSLKTLLKKLVPYLRVKRKKERRKRIQNGTKEYKQKMQGLLH